jgi:hypothetical protein
VVARLTHWILVGQTPLEVASAKEWADWFEKHSMERILAQQNVPGGWLSTVFLGIDHNWTGHGLPVLFETMLFPSSHDLREEGQWRWRSYLEAERGHEAIVQAIMQGKPLPPSPW